MNKIVSGFSLLFCLTVSLFSNAQADSSEHLVVKAGLFYNSRLNYYGRTDSLHSSGLLPMVELWLDGKFYINAVPVFVTNSGSAFQYAGTVATAGYESLSDNKKWLNNFYVAKPFYKQTQAVVQSALKAQAGFSFTHLHSLLDVSAGGDIKWSHTIDYSISLGMDHIFRKQISKSFVLIADPSLYTYAGTLQLLSGSGNKNSLLPLSSVAETGPDATRFDILAAEFSAPIIFSINSVQLIITPSWIMPFDREVTNSPGEITPNYLFYVVAGARIVIK